MKAAVGQVKEFAGKVARDVEPLSQEVGLNVQPVGTAVQSVFRGVSGLGQEMGLPTVTPTEMRGHVESLTGAAAAMKAGKPSGMFQSMRSIPDSELHELFAMVDRDGSGHVSEEELLHAFQQAGHDDMTLDGCRMMMRAMRPDHSATGDISLEDLRAFLSQAPSPEEVESLYRRISPADRPVSWLALREALSTQGEPIPVAMLDEWFAHSGITSAHLGNSEFHQLLNSA